MKQPRSKNVPILTDMHAEVVEYSNRTGITITRIVQDALSAYLNEKKEQEEFLRTLTKGK